MSGPQIQPRVQPLTQYTGFLLRRAFVRSSRCARDCMPADAPFREVSALSILAERGPLSQRSLGAVAHVNRSLVVKLVDTLEAKSWVVRQRDEHDRRSYALTLTDAGLAALAGFRRDLDSSEAALTESLTHDEAGQLRSWLTALLADDPSIDISSLADRTGYLIAHAHRLLRELAESRLRPLGLAPRSFGLLSTIGREQPCSQNRVAASLGISAPGVLPLLAELEEAGLVSRLRNPEDRRVYDLTLTDPGRQLLVQAQGVAAKVQEEVRERLGDAGDRDLRRLLRKLIG